MSEACLEIGRMERVSDCNDYTWLPSDDLVVLVSTHRCDEHLLLSVQDVGMRAFISSEYTGDITVSTYPEPLSQS